MYHAHKLKQQRIKSQYPSTGVGFLCVVDYRESGRPCGIKAAFPKVISSSSADDACGVPKKNNAQNPIPLHDAIGNLTSEIVNNGLNSAFSGTTNYLYDNKSQLLNESSTRNSGLNNVFGYDAMGNPTSWKGYTRTFNPNNQETTGGATQFAYDGNGNPTTYKGSSFAFNENDKLTNVTTSGSVLLQAGYRSDGLRGWK